MDTINVRKHGVPTYKKSERYLNYDAEVTDGEVKMVVKPVVARSQASDYSVTMNALTRGESPHRSRLNVDAVDLPEVLDNFNKNEKS